MRYSELWECPRIKLILYYFNTRAPDSLPNFCEMTQTHKSFLGRDVLIFYGFFCSRHCLVFYGLLLVLFYTRKLAVVYLVVNGTDFVCLNDFPYTFWKCSYGVVFLIKRVVFRV